MLRTPTLNNQEKVNTTVCVLCHLTTTSFSLSSFVIVALYPNRVIFTNVGTLPLWLACYDNQDFIHVTSVKPEKGTPGVLTADRLFLPFFLIAQVRCKWYWMIISAFLYSQFFERTGLEVTVWNCCGSEQYIYDLFNMLYVYCVKNISFEVDRLLFGFHSLLY